MATDSKMIDLGRPYDSPITTDSPSAAKPAKIDYPSLSISTEKAIPFPSGDFEAAVTLKLKRGSFESKDESGAKRFSYIFDVKEICDCSDNEDSSDDAGETEEEPEDAAAAILKSMGRARTKKMAESDQE